MKRRILRRLIWVYAICKCSLFNRLHKCINRVPTIYKLHVHQLKVNLRDSRLETQIKNGKLYQISEKRLIIGPNCFDECL